MLIVCKLAGQSQVLSTGHNVYLYEKSVPNRQGGYSQVNAVTTYRSLQVHNHHQSFYVSPTKHVTRASGLTRAPANRSAKSTLSPVFVPLYPRCLEWHEARLGSRPLTQRFRKYQRWEPWGLGELINRLINYLSPPPTMYNRPTK